MPALIALVFAVALNIYRAKRGKSTICSTTRRHIPATVFLGLWAGFNAWFIPHWIVPRIKKKGWF